MAKNLLLHSSSHQNLDYTAREDRPHGADSLLRHYVGVFDPMTGHLQVVEAKKMAVRGTVRSQQASEEAMGQRTERSVSDVRSGRSGRITY